jgi:hypothetical protein
VQLVWRPNRGQGDGSTREVVFTVVPAASLGAVPGGRVRPGRGPGRRATRGDPHADRTKRQDWARLLGDLARQIEDGRIYDRDLLALSIALNAVHEVFGRRIGASRSQPTQAPRPHRQG